MSKKAILLFMLVSMPLGVYADDNGDGATPVPTISTDITPMQLHQPEAAAPAESPAVRGLDNSPMAEQLPEPRNAQPFTVKGSNEEDKANCKARLKKYLDQQVCMGPYHNKNGGIRPEAFKKCGPDVKYPIDCPMQ